MLVAFSKTDPISKLIHLVLLNRILHPIFRRPLTPAMHRSRRAPVSLWVLPTSAEPVLVSLPTLPRVLLSVTDRLIAATGASSLALSRTLEKASLLVRGRLTIRVPGIATAMMPPVLGLLT